MIPEVIEAARAAYKAGLSVVPPRTDGSKRPVGNWKDFQTTRASAEQMRQWFSGRATGLGAIMGAVSGNAELLEFDCRQTYVAFLDVAQRTGLADVVARLEAGYVEDTPNGGVHWLYRCSEIAGNTKLATRPTRPDERKDEHDRVRVLIETRGEGGFVVLAPSCGLVHPTGRPYLLRAGGFATIPTLTPDERAALWQLARTFDELPPPPPKHAPPAPPADPSSTRPGDVLTARATWADVLQPAGWTHVFHRNGTDYWRRPGKASGVSATTNHGGADLLIVFSSSTPFETGRGYGKFGAYARLYHQDDYAAAARALVQAGFGESAPVPTIGQLTAAPVDAAAPAPTAPARRQPTLQHMSDVVAGLMQAYDAGAPPVVPTPFSDLNWLCNGGFAPGELVFLGARPGVGKTALALELARTAAKTAPVLFVSREMIARALARRMVAQDGRVSASRLRKHALLPVEMRRFSEAIERLANLHLWVTDDTVSLSEIHLLMAQAPNGQPWKLLIVDYLQLVHAPSDVKDRRLQVEAVSQGLKEIATAHQIPVIVLSALRRPPQGNPRPTLADLRESGELEHDADLILMLHRPDADPTSPNVECWIDKNRDGETGRVDLVFSREFVSFAQLERDHA